MRALDGVSLDLHAGRVLGVVGESGCGKSVTARAILRLIDRPGRIASGRVLLDPGAPRAAGSGRARSRKPRDAGGARRPHRADLPGADDRAQRALHRRQPDHRGDARAQRHLARPRRASARSRCCTRSASRARRRRIDAYPFQLSGGLRQRVGIALALAADPQILIADEPTTALDVTTQAQILALLRRLQRTKGMALMLITHDMGVIAQMADDVAVMYLGRIVEFAPVRQLFAAPRHPYTRALLRSVPNMRRCRAQRLATIGGAVPHPGARPVGCPFHPRCPEVIDGRCATQAPPAMPPGERGRELLPCDARRRAA